MMALDEGWICEGLEAICFIAARVVLTVNPSC